MDDESARVDDESEVEEPDFPEDPVELPTGEEAEESESDSATEEAANDDSEPGPDGRAGTQVSVERSQFDADTINVIANLYQGASLDGPGLLELRACLTLSLQQLDFGTRALRFDPTSLESGRRALAERRLLWVLGPPEIGKLSFVQKLIVHSAEKGGVATGVRVLLKAPLGSETRIDLGRLCRQVAKREPNGCLVVIEDSPQGNPSLADWAEDLDGAKLQAIESRLADAGCKVLLVSDASGRLGVRNDLERLGVAFSLTFPDLDALRGLMLAEATKLLPSDEQGERRLEELSEELTEEGARVWSVLTTFPRVVRFFHRHGAAVVDGRLSLREAIDRFEDLSLWLLQDLAQDLDDWCSVLALMLCQAERHQSGTPWLVFHQLRYELLIRLERRLRRDEEPHELKSLLAPDLLRLGIGVVSSAFPLGMRVRFLAPNLAERLWDTVMSSGHGLASLLVSELTAIAERCDDQPALRRAAAAALGRLGEIEPSALLDATMQRWEAQEAPLLLGGLCCGVWGSEEERYRLHCLDRLKRSMRADPPVASRTAAVALAHLGHVDWRCALEGLQAALPGLSRALPDLAAKSREIHQRMREDDRSSKLSLGAAVRLYLFASLPPPVWTRLEALQFGLVGLCFAGRSLEVLAEAVVEGEDGLEPAQRDVWLLILLWSQGVLEIVQRYDRDVPGESEEGSRLNLILGAAWVAEDGVDALAGFFVRCFDRGLEISGPIGRLFRDGWLRLLTGWTLGAVDDPTARGLLGGVYRHLLRVSPEGSPLRSAVFDSLQRLPRRRRGSDKEERLVAFVREVLSR